MRTIIVLFLCLIVCKVSAEQKEESSRFVFFIRSPSEDKLVSDKINSIVEKKLKTVGNIEIKSLVMKEGYNDNIDFSGFENRSTLKYELKKISSVDGKELSIVQASLQLNSEKSAPVWLESCFVQGTLEKDAESVASKSLDFLLKKFSDTYFSSHLERPSIYFYPQ